jgi:tRNA threonylcarbamoyladenosine modification (KEOPS) complex  Pcc1 subunit
MSAIYDFILEQGADFYRELTYRDAEGSPYDVTSYKGKMQLRPEVGADIILELNDTNGRIKFGTTDGKIYLSVPADDLADLDFDVAAYDLILIPQTGKAVKVLQGTVTFAKAVTQ